MVQVAMLLLKETNLMVTEHQWLSLARGIVATNGKRPLKTLQRLMKIVTQRGSSKSACSQSPTWLKTIATSQQSQPDRPQPPTKQRRTKSQHWSFVTSLISTLVILTWPKTAFCAKNWASRLNYRYHYSCHSTGSSNSCQTSISILN